jgi:ADP-heptose:LPS heptosyltransferase
MLHERKMKPLDYILVQWASAETKKDYPWMKEVVLLLKERGENVIVTHHDPAVIPELGVVTAIGVGFRLLGVLCELASVVVGPDSSLQHFAAAVRTPSLGLFGPTNPTLYLKHYPLAEYLWNTKVESHHACVNTMPCFGVTVRNHWCRTRPKQAPWCLEQITPQEVVDKIIAVRQARRDANFYDKKRDFLSKNGSEAFFSDNPHLNIATLQAVKSTVPLDTQLRRTTSVARKPCGT